MPAKFHPDISKTVACRRLLAFEKRNSSTFEATPPSPGGSGAKKFFLHIFFWVRSMTSSHFQIKILQKNLVKNSPPGGSDPQNFWKSGSIPARVMCLQNCIHISLKLWPVDVCYDSKKRNSSTFEVTPPRPGGSGAKTFFLLIFSWVRSMTRSNFQIEILQKNLRKISPRGV